MPRRRRRLGHLSNDQKMLRRKLKNRVAAQNARDKKKTESENLKLENEKLLRLVHKLQNENLQKEVIILIRTPYETVRRMESPDTIRAVHNYINFPSVKPLC